MAVKCRQLATRCRDEVALLTRRIDCISLFRLATAAVTALLAVTAVAEPKHRAWFLAGSVPSVYIFVELVRRTNRLDTRRQFILGRAHVNEQAAFRAERTWSRIEPQPWTWKRDLPERWLDDLDILGTESLVQLFPPVSQALGAPRLREWMSAQSETAELRERQESVRELVAAWELRDRFALSATQRRLTRERITRFTQWAHSAVLAQPKWLRAVSFALPVLSCISLISAQANYGLIVAAVSIVMTGLISLCVRWRVRETIEAATAFSSLAEAYADIVDACGNCRFVSRRLVTLQNALASGERNAHRALRQLGSIQAWADVKSSPMMHAILQALFLWDWHVARAFDHWRDSYGYRVPEWFSALADIECLAALAGIAHLHPTWVFPDVEPIEPMRIQASALGHPLLSAKHIVLNDVEIGPPGSVLLLSGSNMSGKSTLLRAVGLNVVLARMGSPVCAAAMRCPPVHLMTSIRIRDSLPDGISYFMSEVLCLRDIVVAAEATDGPPVLYLVDEVLRGTNSEERAVAVRIIVRRLLNTHAIGVLTTHDLDIFNMPELADSVRHAHFSENFTADGAADRLVFDYRLRPGPTTARNALTLLALVGLSK